jgi:SAM-dependent methyltransferase
MSFSTQWEDEVYSQNKQINRYPYGEFVSIFFNALKFLPKEKEVKTTKILELGCGTANNIKFMLELGYDAHGIDGSQSACEIGNSFLSNQGLNPNITQAMFQQLPYDNDSFDMIVDREAMYCGTIDTIKKSWQEANRVLKKGGIVISFMYTTDNKWCQKANSSSDLATKIEQNTFVNFKEGNFKDTGIVHFTEYDELFNIFDFLNIKLINKHGNNTVFSDVSIEFSYDEWIVVGVKK